jgi:hypothetical protein
MKKSNSDDNSLDEPQYLYSDDDSFDEPQYSYLDEYSSDEPQYSYLDEYENRQYNHGPETGRRQIYVLTRVRCYSKPNIEPSIDVLAFSTLEKALGRAVYVWEPIVGEGNVKEIMNKFKRSLHERFEEYDISIRKVTIY